MTDIQTDPQQFQGKITMDQVVESSLKVLQKKERQIKLIKIGKELATNKDYKSGKQSDTNIAIIFLVINYIIFASL